MKKFLIHSVLFLGLLAIPVVWLFSQADGYTDPFYLRFTSPKQQSMIIGTSRSAQGIRPDVLNVRFPEVDFYNYSFTIVHSPYGPSYFKSIQRKIDKSSKGTFIVAVDPWSIASVAEDPNDETRFVEKKNAVGNTDWVSMDPNVVYLLNNYNNSYFNLLKEKANPKELLHDDGWLEITVRMDPGNVRGRTKAKVKSYTKKFQNQRFSEVRMQYLDKIITFLQKNGDVYMVRLPISKEVMEIEKRFSPDFNTKMEKLSNEKGVPYLDLTPQNELYTYTDGNHLYKESAKEVSERIAEWIEKENLN